MKLSNVVVILVVALVVFMSGFVVGRKGVQPKIITETKVEKIYSSPPGVTFTDICDSFYGKYADELKEKAKQEAETIKQEATDWRRGYEAGYQDK